MDKRRKETIFFGVIAICTLIIAMIGATLAFFSATSRGTENAVSATADVVSIVYSEEAGTAIQASNLIPSDVKYVKKAYNGSNGHGNCKDDNDREICSKYHFKITNNGSSSANIIGKIDVALNEFTNLKYLVYKKGATTDELILDSTALNATAGDDVSIFGIGADSSYNKIVVPNDNQEKEYIIVVYLEEAGTANDIEQGKKFAGTVSLSVAGGNVTGYIADEE